MNSVFIIVTIFFSFTSRSLATKYLDDTNRQNKMGLRYQYLVMVSMVVGHYFPVVETCTGNDTARYRVGVSKSFIHELSRKIPPTLKSRNKLS
jgi:hypothetical protein